MERFQAGCRRMRTGGAKMGQRIEAFESVNAYPFVAHLLGLTPNPGIDGRLDVLAPVLSGR